MSGDQPLARVLIVAGSDSGGGAGIQADLKTVMAMGGYGTTAITALTAQNTLGVSEILDVPSRFVSQQIRSVMDDIGADAVKAGMLHRREVIEAFAESWEAYGRTPLVLDPVMIAKGGASLLTKEAEQVLSSLLLPHAFILTPNMPEASVLTGRDVETLDDMKRAADRIMDKGVSSVLIKGGHGHDRVVSDLLAEQSGFTIFENERLTTQQTHGTGCTLASAIATGVGQSLPLSAAVERAIRYVRAAIKAAPGLGNGHGPLNHRINF